MKKLWRDAFLKEHPSAENHPHEEDAHVRLSIIRHMFDPMIQVSIVPKELPAARLIDDPAAFFHSADLVYHTDQRGFDLLPRAVIKAMPRADYTDDEDACNEDVIGTCRLMLENDARGPFVEATAFIAAGALIGLYASEICLATALPNDERSSMWIIDLGPCDAYSGPPLAFSVIAGGNLLRFMRHSAPNDGENVALETTWLKGRPYLVCRALVDINPGSQLCYNWGSDFVSQLAWYDLRMAAGLSHALHRMSEPIVPPMDLTVRLGRDECVLFAGTAGERRIAVNDNVGNAKRVKRETTTVCVRELVPEYLDTRQVVTERARAVLSVEEAGLPTWKHLFATKHHDRVRQLMTSSESSGVEICRLDSLTHHVRWMSLPSTDQYGVFATRHLRAAVPVLMYKGRLCCEDELNERADNDDCVHYNHTVPFGNLVIDSNTMGNEARFVNDAHGSGLGNNCDFVWTWDDEQCEPALFIVPNRRIQSGEELLCDYGEAFWEEHTSLQMQSHCRYWYRRLFGVPDETRIEIVDM